MLRRPLNRRSSSRGVLPRRYGLVLLAGVALAACAPVATSPPPAPPPAPGSSLMGASSVNVAQLASWFSSHSPGGYAATVPVDQLAQLYLEEGAAEGVRGDIAFAQSIVEVGWFRFNGSVPNWYNNFAGIRNADSTAYEQYADARTGVRAQIQHLRRYGDAGASACAAPPLHNPCADPRFGLVVPAGKATDWHQMGNGNWATDPTYATKVLNLYNSILASAGLPGV